MRANDDNSCHDCGVMPGEQHIPGCDVERCPLCGYQAISCNCVYRVNNMDVVTLEYTHPDIYSNGPTPEMTKAYEDAVAGRWLKWTGEWPGDAECREFGWYSRMEVEVGRGWARCEKDAPGADTDLNRLYSGEAVWSVDRGRWVLLKEGQANDRPSANVD